MIRYRDLVPSIYYDESRDFQALGRTLEVVFNYCKTSIDLMRELPYTKNMDNTLLPLLATSLGFNVKRNYDINELRSLCGSFVELLREKGSLNAIQDAINIVLNANNIIFNTDISSISIDPNDKYNLNIFVPYELMDTSLLDDVFDYILPCGFTYNYIRYDGNTREQSVTTSSIQDYLALGRYIDGGKHTQLGLVANPSNILTEPKFPSLEEGKEIYDVVDSNKDLSIIQFGVVTKSEGPEEE